MFNDIGGKLKGLAKVTTILGIISSVLSGIVQMIDQPLAGILIMVLGSVLFWISSFTIYGLGQLIENTDELVKQGRQAPAAPRSPMVPEAQPAYTAPVPQPTPVYVAPAAQPAPQHTAPAAQPAPQHAAPAAQPSETAVEGIPAENGKILCPTCGTIQNANRRVCFRCGQPLHPMQ